MQLTQKRFIITGFAVAICLCLLLVLVAYRHAISAWYQVWFAQDMGSDAEWDELVTREAATDAIQSVSGTLRLLFVGDTSFGESYQSTHFMATKGYERSLEHMIPVLDQADWTLANLETALTDLADSPLTPIKTYAHWGHPQRTAGLLAKHGIRSISLANNHSLDYGMKGLLHTLQAVHGQGISWIGAGRTKVLAEMPLHQTFEIGRTTFSLTVVAGFEHRTDYRWSYRFYAAGEQGGVNGWSKSRAIKQVEQIRSKSPHTYLVAYPHWGKNYRWATDAQRRMAYAMIDAGADLVIGHGAHMLQEVERYQGKWILYSLGNFVFNSPGRYHRRSAPPFSLAAFLEVSPDGNSLAMSLRLYPILSNNRVTDYQPRLVTQEQRDLIREILLMQAPDPSDLSESMQSGSDDLGHYLRLPAGRSGTSENIGQ